MKKKKRQRTKGQEEVRPFEGLSKVNQNAAGVDIGATEIVACVSGGEEVQWVKAFGNYTVDLQSIAKWFHEHKIKTVAMESTGVYWIPLFEELERQGFECLLTPALSCGASVSMHSNPCRSNSSNSGIQYTPVLSIATVLTLCSWNHFAMHCRSTG